MQLEGAPTFRPRQIVFPVVIVAVAIALYVWGAHLEAKNDQALNEQAGKLVSSLDEPGRLEELLAGDDIVIDSLLPQLPQLLGESGAARATFEIEEVEDDEEVGDNATHKVIILTDGQRRLAIRIVHPGQTSRMDVTGFVPLDQ